MTTDQNEKLMFALTAYDKEGNRVDSQVFQSDDYCILTCAYGREQAKYWKNYWQIKNHEVRWVTINQQGDVLENKVYM